MRLGGVREGHSSFGATMQRSTQHLARTALQHLRAIANIRVCNSSHQPLLLQPLALAAPSTWPLRGSVQTACTSSSNNSSSTATAASASHHHHHHHQQQQQEGVQHGHEGPPAHLAKMKVHFCRVCGSPVHLIKLGEHEWRHTCSNAQCGYIDYMNPKVVVGCIAEHEGHILLCRRAIEPCKGMWTVPAGFMELAESTAEGAARETREEACTSVHVIAPYAHWDIPVIGQAYILFRGKLLPPYTHGPGPESLETRLFLPSEIPFDHIAFSSVSLSLRLYLEDMQSGHWRMHHGVIDKKPGAGPNDPSTFGLGQLLQFSLRD